MFSIDGHFKHASRKEIVKDDAVWRARLKQIGKRLLYFLPMQKFADEACHLSEVCRPEIFKIISLKAFAHNDAVADVFVASGPDLAAADARIHEYQRFCKLKNAWLCSAEGLTCE